MNSFRNIKTGILVTLWSVCSFAQQTKPNVVVILTDDQGYQDVGCFGSPDIETPNLDKMAKEGMRFTDFYVADPVCSPSRAALLTGCYPRRVGVPKVLFPNRKAEGLEAKYVTIADVLQAVGYATKAIGKWHLGDQKQFLPTANGFDSYYGIPYSNDMMPAKNMEYAGDCLFREGVTLESLKASLEKSVVRKNHVMNTRVPLMRNERCIEFPVDQSTITERYTNEGIRFITNQTKAKKPFFLYLAHSMPHVPLYASKKFKGKSKRGLYGDVIEEIDYNVGRLLQHLQKLGVDKNTLVVFTSDNGPWLVKGKNGGSALPLFEGKMTFFDGGLRVPAIMRWPGKIPSGKVCNELASTIDLLPTIANITGARIKTSYAIDGKDIWDLMTDKKNVVSPHKYFFYRDKAVRWGDWKYHKQQVYKVKATKRANKGEALYHLGEDIGEAKNVIDKYPKITTQLRKALEAHNLTLTKQ
ncbi:sulfatase family protein [Wenyingzhuangia sp. IMCC45574]